MKVAIAAFCALGIMTMSAGGCNGSVSTIVPGAIEQSFTGSSFIVGTDSGGVTTVHHLVATGRPSNAHIEALIRFKPHAEHGIEDARCHKRFKYGAELISMTWVQVYDDGSGFTGAVDTEDVGDVIVCTDGRNFHVNVRNAPIVETVGKRFEGFDHGTWSATATAGHALTAGTVSADFKAKAEKN